MPVKINPEKFYTKKSLNLHHLFSHYLQNVHLMKQKTT